MKNVEKNIEMSDKKSNTQGVSPHLVAQDCKEATK